MIAVIAKDNEIKAVREFFELFKTPWEVYVRHRSYDLVIATCDEVPEDINSRVLVVYNSRSIRFDDQIGVATELKGRCDWVEFQGVEFPVYGEVALCRGAGRALLRHRATLETVGTELVISGRPTIRVGFDLFQEVAFLLSQGQPPENAHIPALEVHVSLLRAVMVSAGVPFVEVPPVPAGYDFMVCLTHDVDFVGIRDHKWDHTMWGFVYRCFVGSLVNVVKGRLGWSKCLQNWKAGLSLPLVYLGFRDDFWLEFGRYMQMEKGLGSTFFFIPFKNVAGTIESTCAPRRRAAKYDLAEIKEHLQELLEGGCEIGLHGIDAWQNSEKAHAELHRFREVTGQSDVGIRMHRLYWAAGSEKALEEAGFSYDSTSGYNNAVGFRAGTTQAFCPLGFGKLLELPLNIQDTAMFYSDRMQLSETDALDACKRLIDSTVSFGGALTVNWHTRSLSPERLWGDFYAKLLEEIRTHRVWFGTAGEIVRWFQKRRSLQFDSVRFEDHRVHVELSNTSFACAPPLKVRVHHPRSASDESAFPTVWACTEAEWNGEELLEIPY